MYILMYMYIYIYIYIHTERYYIFHAARVSPGRHTYRHARGYVRPFPYLRLCTYDSRVSIWGGGATQICVKTSGDQLLISDSSRL